MNKTLAIATTVAALAAPSSAGAARFTVQSRGNLSGAQLAAVERAVSYQVDHQVARFWPGARAAFGPAGIPINLVPMRTVRRNTDGNGDTAYHTTGVPSIVIGEAGLRQTEYEFDHEVVETVVDPSGFGHEIEDPFDGTRYTGVGGATLGDFATPAYFDHTSGPRDFLGYRRLKHRIKGILLIWSQR